jgi:DNA mismatch repair protein MutL
LFNIHSLGFRGEALYSICAIADVILRSRTKGEEAGWEIHMRGGKKLNLHPVTMNVGTEIEIKELFFNTPARRKFLKSNTTELNQILSIVIPYALLYPNIAFNVAHQNKRLLDLSPASNFLDRAAETLNVDKKHLLEVKQEFIDAGISIHLILGDINIARPRRDLQFIFINNRPVQSRSLSFHLNEIYRLILPPGTNPFFICYVMIPAENIDVNIHPTKREVKIKDEQNLIALLRQITQNALLTGGGPKQVESPISSGKEEFVIRRLFTETKTQDTKDTSIDDLPKIFDKISKGLTPSPTEQYSFPKQDEISFAGEQLIVSRQENLAQRLSRSKFIGSFINKFLIFEEGNSLLIIDQHAAQERITFEQLIQQMEKGKVEVQHLLSPYTVKLSPQELLTWEECKSKLDEIGFSTSQFDPTTVAIHTYPVLLKYPDKAFQDILAGGNVIRCDHETIARRACRCSIMAGDPLSPEQSIFLRDQLIKTQDPFTCPHGRPTLIEIKESFLDKQFLRT